MTRRAASAQRCGEVLSGHEHTGPAYAVAGYPILEDGPPVVAALRQGRLAVLTDTHGQPSEPPELASGSSSRSCREPYRPGMGAGVYVGWVPTKASASQNWAFYASHAFSLIP